MAKEAIMRIKQAEDLGNAEIKKAAEQAKLVVKNAEAEGSRQQKEIIAKANKEKQEIIQKSTDEALKECEPLLKACDEALVKISNPEPQKLNKTVNLIMERIVNGNGCC